MKIEILPDLIFYRYDGYNRITADEYVCVRETPCSYWIVPKFYISAKPRLIRKNAERSYAYPTKLEALVSFLHRKRWQIIHLERQLANAKQAQHMANRGQVDEEAVWVPLDTEFIDLK